jgi:alpha-L-fucosidase
VSIVRAQSSYFGVGVGGKDRCAVVTFLSLLFIFTSVSASAQLPDARSSDFASNIRYQLDRVHTEIAQNNNSTPFKSTWESLGAYRTPDWFRDAKFGIFIHWGVYSVPAFGSEWYSRNMYDPGSKDYAHHITTYGPQTQFGYKDFIPLFKGERFDPTLWVDLFARAGARYIVPVAEHCDGFAMYASDMTPWNASVMGPHRDVVGDLATAARLRGLHFGVSSHVAEHWWWYGVGRSYPSDVRDQTAVTAMLYGPASPRSIPNSDGKTDDSKAPDPNHLERWLAPDLAWVENWLARSTELVDKYHPDFFYFDWWSGQPAYRQSLREFAAYYYDRSSEQGISPVLTYKEESMPANTATLDIERGKLGTLRQLPWQTDTSISIHSWGYVDHDEYRTAKSLIHQLLDTVSKNGNLLLNVGPKADGTIPDQARSILLEMGEWLRINGEAVFGSRPFLVFGEGPTKDPPNPTQMNSDLQVYTPFDVRYTTSHDGAIVYAAILGVPPDRSIVLHTLYRGNPYLAAPVCSVRLLGSAAAIEFLQQPDGIRLIVPQTVKISDIGPVFRLETTCRRTAR